MSGFKECTTIIFGELLPSFSSYNSWRKAGMQRFYYARYKNMQIKLKHEVKKAKDLLVTKDNEKNTYEQNSELCKNI